MTKRHLLPLAALAVALVATGCPAPNTGTPTTPTPTGAATQAPTGSATTAPTAAPGGTTPTASPASTPTASPTTTPTQAPAAANYFAADLMNSASGNPGAGAIAVARLNDAGTRLTVRLFSVGASGNLTGAHLHAGAAGTDGPVIKPLDIDTGSQRTASLTWDVGTAATDMTAAQLADMRAGKIYAAIHTEKNPNGEARGQFATASQAFYADLTTANGATGANTARGAAWLTLDASNQATIKVYTAGLTGDITGAHLHRGGAADNGPVVLPLTLGGDKRSASGTWARTGENALTDALLTDLRANMIYVAVHTQANPNGEIRGQLMLP